MSELQWVGLMLFVAGFALRAWSLAHLKKVGIETVPELSTTSIPPHGYTDQGPYEVANHPAYIGSVMSFLGLGWLIFAAFWPGVLVAWVSVPHFIHRAAEEDRLRRLAEAMPKNEEERRQNWERDVVAGFRDTG
jgi:protein-S-isoprenylcysteine O-methyltransferase Ste14